MEDPEGPKAQKITVFGLVPFAIKHPQALEEV